MSRRTKRARRYTRRTFTGRQSLWSWTSVRLLVQQRAWLGLCERDKRQPPHHYNLHIQPACGGQDYHNYHIRYLGVLDDSYVWSVVDAPYGRERSHRIYAFPQRHLFGDAIDAASSSLVGDILSDVGDNTLWLPLAEHLPHVLRDLYHHGSSKNIQESTTTIAKSRSPYS